VRRGLLARSDSVTVGYIFGFSTNIVLSLDFSLTKACCKSNLALLPLHLAKFPTANKV